jgi:ABC-type antimicrobial peptide transport system permease subunit
VYGVIAYSVAQRTHEIGIRVALGARGGEVLKLIVREGFQPILAGMLIGIVASVGVSWLLAATLLA